MQNILNETLFKIDDVAKNYIKSLLEEEKGRGDVFLRLIVETGGCAGLKYHYIVDDYLSEDTDFMYLDGEKKILVIDDYSLEYLKGSQMNLKEDLESTELKITNPNADGSCGCGSSFSCSGS